MFFEAVNLDILTGFFLLINVDVIAS